MTKRISIKPFNFMVSGKDDKFDMVIDIEPEYEKKDDLIAFCLMQIPGINLSAGGKLILARDLSREKAIKLIRDISKTNLYFGVQDGMGGNPAKFGLECEMDKFIAKYVPAKAMRSFESHVNNCIMFLFR